MNVTAVAVTAEDTSSAVDRAAKTQALTKEERLLGLEVCSGGFLPDSVLALRSDRRGSALQEEEKITVYIIHARDQDSHAASVLVAPRAVEPVDRLMCLRESTYGR